MSELCSIPEVALEFEVSQATVRNWIKQEFCAKWSRAGSHAKVLRSSKPPSSALCFKPGKCFGAI